MSFINYCPECGTKIENNTKYCSNCGRGINKDQNVKSKKEKVLNNSDYSKRKGLFGGLATILIVSALIFYLNGQPSNQEAIIDDQPSVISNVIYPNIRFDPAYSVALSDGDKIVLPLDVVKERKFIKFDYIGKSTTIPILAYFTEEGKVVTAISVCEPCDSKDFHIKGTELICNSCGTTWNLNNLDAISGSCGNYPPDPIPSIVVGNEIQINEEDVVGWSRRI